jgi:ubiquitin-protein ligase
MNRVSRIRIQKDFSDLLTDLRKNKNIHYEEDPECELANVRDMSQFTILLKGPSNSPYENGKFRLKIKVPSNYPNEPPIIKIITPTYHPNIKNQDICLDILDNNWKPTYNLSKIFESVYYLLKNPNSSDPLSVEANNEYIKNYDQYIRNAKEWTEKFAK